MRELTTYILKNNSLGTQLQDVDSRVGSRDHGLKGGKALERAS